MSVKKTWVARSIDLLTAESLSRQLSIPILIAKILVGRNVVDKANAQEFLQPSLKNLLEPLLFRDMDRAVIRIGQAIINHEKIGIFGDYDVDGVCSTALLQQFFGSINAKLACTLPHRLNEGYGLSMAGIDRLKDQQVSLIITADCGSNSHDQIAYANSLGLNVIVVDHHTLSETLPPAYAVINPKRRDCESGATYLCAAGVAFFLCVAIRRNLREQGFFSQCQEPDLRQLLDLVALATVCDVVPLVKDNRALVKAGLKILTAGKRLGLLALMEASGVNKDKLSSVNLGFHLGPRINAAGRIDDANYALKLLACGNKADAQQLALGLDSTNQERRAIEEATVEEACFLIETNPEYQDQPALVLQQPHWHPGVVGIVASRIAERYHRPAIIIGTGGKGSGRSIKGIDLHCMVSQAAQSLDAFGGHAHAIGVTLGSRGVNAFRQDLLAVMMQVPATVFNKEIFYDIEIRICEVSLELIEELSRLEPFGAQNPHPIVRINRCFMRNLRRLTGGHIRGELENADGFLSFIGFRMDVDDELANCSLDVLGILEKNEWQGRICPQMRLIDFQKTGSGDG